MNTADASTAHIRSYNMRTAGAGVAQADRAVDTLGLATTGPGEASLSYGYEALGGAYSETKTISLWNTGSSAISYALAASSPLVTLSDTSVTVPAGGSVDVEATAALSACPGGGTADRRRLPWSSVGRRELAAWRGHGHADLVGCGHL